LQHDFCYILNRNLSHITGGLLGIFTNFPAYQRWCRTTSERAQYYQMLLWAGSPAHHRCHQQLHQPDQNNRQGAPLCYCLSCTCLPWSGDWCPSCWGCWQNAFIRDRLQGGCKTSFQLLVKSQVRGKPVDLDELMRYYLSPVPHSLGTPDGFFAETNKASMLHFLLDENTDEVPYPKDAIFIQDGNALSCSHNPPSHIWKNLPADTRPDVSQEKLHLFHWLLPAWLHQGTGKAEVWLFW